MTTDFTPISALGGGALIGLAAVALMAFHGRIAGMTGIMTGLLPPIAADWGWRAAFLLGAIGAPMLMVFAGGQAVGFDSPVPGPWLIVGGLIVGIGVYFGSGCTSGHGVCGIARLSPRSLAATLTFMTAAVATVFVVRHVLGGL
ncbi:YeeE/YedE family protein [Devosia sp.]|uniref:YeeE/YedE family protein n=1 Tax=Devosia sp. TaxID=1871048 RepID=UPI001AD264B7|nr:YeeE/YedE family protein [Devosia sp.]MBN9309238.1 YeeE/YedE family protein [Devosia sp.]